MNRRNFLKSLAAAIIIPTLPVALISNIGPVRSRGVTNAQLAELIKLTLQDLPTKCFGVNWAHADYSILRFYGVKLCQ